METLIYVAAFFLILIGLIAIHAKVNGGFKIETSWIALALSPAIVWLLTTGQLTEFSGFGLAFKLRQASSEPFSLAREGDRIEPQPITLEAKGGIGKIDELIENRIAALTLQLHRKGYYRNAAIQEYLERLTNYDFFRYVVFVDQQETFSGMVPARKLLNQIRQPGFNLVKIIETGKVNKLKDWNRISITTNNSKREALTLMERHNLVELAVTNGNREFIGVVEREKLLGSIVLKLITRP